MLGPHAGIVEPGGDRVRLLDLPVGVGEYRGAGAVEDGRSPVRQTRGAFRLDTDKTDVRVLEEAGEEPDRVRAAADAGGDSVLTRAGLRDDSPLAEPGREQSLADRVVDLVRPGVAEILALEEDPPP